MTSRLWNLLATIGAKADRENWSSHGLYLEWQDCREASAGGSQISICSVTINVYTKTEYILLTGYNCHKTLNFITSNCHVIIPWYQLECASYCAASPTHWILPNRTSIATTPSWSSCAGLNVEPILETTQHPHPAGKCAVTGSLLVFRQVTFYTSFQAEKHNEHEELTCFSSFKAYLLRRTCFTPAV